jgi:hypothetical protein
VHAAVSALKRAQIKGGDYRRVPNEHGER